MARIRDNRAPDHIAFVPAASCQVCGASRPACGKVIFAGFGFSALRFIVAVITVLAVVLILDLDIAFDTRVGSVDEGEVIAGARCACSAILLDRMKIIAQAFNQGKPSRQP
jgi:hypothetical protein